MMSVGSMEKGDYICVHQDEHSNYECLDTEELMREHWLKCFKIPLSDGYHIIVLTDSTKEPTGKVKLPMAVAWYKRGKAYGRAMMGPMKAMPLKGDPKPVDGVSDDSEGDPDASIFDKIPEID